ncbi:MFS transporter [Paraburkholderia azotifigens]|uniref:MFS transporter n=1 Tax=Paraburkholderia azotifigens TaxID=2057004 RepID=A0A5C6V8R6_9BURK|nr:MFS transporter [Paraburkholderia azotifigens]TXC80891.1 MFS transporter [Paraburkholderia azotifigens]
MAAEVAAPDKEASEPSPRSASRRSLRSLDGLNFLMADVRDGLGPFLSVFLKSSQHWDSGSIGIVMAASGLAAAVFQIPAGMLVDSVHAKRLLVALSGLLVAAACMVIAWFPRLAAVFGAQIVLGAASAIIPPSLAALSLGIVGHRLMPARIARNESFNHAGNFTAAVLAGGLGQFVGVHWLFYLVCGFAMASALVVLLIDPRAVDHELARGGETLRTASGAHRPVPLAELWRDRRLRVFLMTVVLFHFGNAAMLPLAGQLIAQTHPGMDVIALSACVIAAQLVMMAVAAVVGRAMKAGVGRKTIFLVALAILPVRGLLFCLTTNPYGIVGIQLLDGVAAGIFGVVAVVITSDLMRGTGRFNVAQGLMALCVGIGAALSNVMGGLVAARFGFVAAYLSLSAIAVLAFAPFACCMSETGREDTISTDALANDAG